MASNVQHVSVQAHVEIEGAGSFDVTTVDIQFTARVAVAKVTLAVGFPMAVPGSTVRPTSSSALSSIQEDMPAKVYINVESSSGVVGAPKGETMIFNGFVAYASPAQVAGDKEQYGFGVEIHHRDIENLNTGSTAFWPWSTAANFDWQAEIAKYDNGWVSSEITVSKIKGSGIWPKLIGYFDIVASLNDAKKGGIAGPLAVSGNCGSDSAGGLAENSVALEALNSIQTVAKLIPRDDFMTEAFASFLKNVLDNDLRSMSFMDQINTLGDKCYFRTVPKADGTIHIVPFQVFDTPLLKVGGNESFDFRPATSGASRVLGVALLSRAALIRQYDHLTPVAGCHTFSVSPSPRGIVSVAQAPGWLAPLDIEKNETTKNNLKNTVEHGAPAAGNQSDSLKAHREFVRSIGGRTAEEIAKHYRYRGNTLQFSSYVRTDICPQSTIQVQAPDSFGDEMSLFGRVDLVHIIIDAGSQTARTDFSLSYVRNNATQQAEAGKGHPFYSDGDWSGAGLLE